MRIIKWAELWKKYKFAAMIVLAGVLLMLLPTSRRTAAEQSSTLRQEGETFSLEQEGYILDSNGQGLIFGYVLTTMILFRKHIAGISLVFL